MLTENIFITSYDQGTMCTLVLESNSHSLWAYLLGPDSKKIEADGFVCSFIVPTDGIQMPVDKGSPPPLVKQYSTANSLIEDLRKEQLQITWLGEEVIVSIDKVPYLVINIKLKTSKSKSISKAGPYGSPL